MYITYAEYGYLGNKYESSSYDRVDETGWTESWNAWRTPFVELYKLFRGYYDSIYQDDTKLHQYYSSMTIFTDHVIKTHWDEIIGCKFEVGRQVIGDDYALVTLTENGAYLRIKQFITDQIKHWVYMNRDDIIRYLSALQLDYEPLENYNRVATYNGTKNHDTTVDSSKSKLAEINAPLHSVGLSQDDDGTYNITSLAVSVSKDRKSSNGKVTNAHTETTSVAPYDSATLKDVVRVTDGTGAGDETDYNLTDETLGMAHVRVGSPDPSVTETEYYTDYSENTRGNIGVTTSQQMLESELQLRGMEYANKICEQCLNTVGAGVFK